MIFFFFFSILGVTEKQHRRDIMDSVPLETCLCKCHRLLSKSSETISGQPLQSVTSINHPYKEET